MNLIKWLEDWYKEKCNGDWEKCYGVRIDTLDNPGWSVDIDLIGTGFEEKVFAPINIYRSEHDWLHCKVNDEKIFYASCSPGKLGEILEIFKNWVTS